MWDPFFIKTTSDGIFNGSVEFECLIHTGSIFYLRAQGFERISGTLLENSEFQKTC